jgi:hypothetical protein
LRSESAFSIVRFRAAGLAGLCPISDPTSDPITPTGDTAMNPFRKHFRQAAPLVLGVVALLVAAGNAAVAAAANDKLPVLQIYTADGTVAPNLFYLGTPANWANVIPQNGKAAMNAGSINVEPTTFDGKTGLKVNWTGGNGQIYSQAKSATDQLDYIDANAAMVFDAVVHTPPEDQVTTRIDCRYPCMGIIDTTEMYKKAGVGKPFVVKIPLACFENNGTKFSAVNTPFLIFTTKKFSMSLANIRWVPGAGKDADALKC